MRDDVEKHVLKAFMLFGEHMIANHYASFTINGEMAPFVMQY